MTVASWQSDPLNRHELRWWDGERWTEHVSDAGIASVDEATTVTLQPQRHRSPGTATSARTRVGLAATAILVVGLAGVIVYRSTRAGDSAVTVLRSGSTETTDVSSPGTPPSTAAVTTAAPTTTVLPETTTAAPATTLAPETTTTVAATTTTVAATTTAPPPPTTSPPPVIAVATVGDLVAAVPQQADLPLGLSPSGDPLDTAPLPASGLGAGYCGGDSAVQRAWNAAAVEIVVGAGYLTSPDAGYLSIDFYAFATPEDASLFMALTTSQETSCLGGFQYQLPEGDGPNEYDGFSDEPSLDAVWDITETLYYSPTEVAGVDEAFQMAEIREATTRYSGTTYAATEIDATQYERHGRIVMVFNLYGECCLAGYIDIDPSLEYQPTTPDLLNWVEALRPGIVQRLQGRGVL